MGIMHGQETVDASHEAVENQAGVSMGVGLYGEDNLAAWVRWTVGVSCVGRAGQADVANACGLDLEIMNGRRLSV
jgi:hypothetical protein